MNKCSKDVFFLFLFGLSAKMDWMNKKEDEIYLNYTMIHMHITSINFYTFTLNREEENRNSNQLKNQMDLKQICKCKIEEGIGTACEHTQTHTQYVRMCGTICSIAEHC